MPNPRIGSVSVVNGRGYVFGGAGMAGGIAHASMFEYDPTTDTWRILDDMPFARFVMTTTAVDGKIYMIGGSGTAYPHTPYLAEVIEYSP